MFSKDQFSKEIGLLSAEIVPEVLETMFFAIAEAVGPEPGPERSLKVRIQFKGCPSGEFHLTVDELSVRELASAFLGVGPEAIGGPEVDQVACELANMLCGSVLSRAESNTGFDLGSPSLVDELDSTGADHHSVFALDVGGALGVAFRLDDAVEVPV